MHLQDEHIFSAQVDNNKQSSSSFDCQWLLTEWWGVMFGENLILGSVRVKEQKVIQVADAVSQRANGEVLGRVGHKVPNHSLTCKHTAQTLVASTY